MSMSTLTLPRFRPAPALPRPAAVPAAEAAPSAAPSSVSPAELRLGAVSPDASAERLQSPRGLVDFMLRVACVLVVLLFAYLLRAPYVAGQASEGTELVVGPGERLSSITRALEQARDGDRIRVLSGTYRESPIFVDKAVKLVGEGFPVLDGEGEHPVLIVRADDVTIQGFEVRDAAVSYTRDHAAIRLEEVSGCVVQGNRLNNNFFGIYLAKTRGCRIVDNVLHASGTREAASGNGIHLWNAKDTYIEGNTIVGHRDGIYLEFAEGATIRGNHSERNLRYGLHFMFSNDTEYTGNSFRNNSAGVAVMYSRRVQIRGNVFEDNWGAASYGLLLKDMTDSEIRGNLFRRNTVGIYSEGSLRNTLTENRFVRNGWAVRMRSNSRDNRFTDNDFIDNSFDVSTDSRRNFNSFVGNFWSRYDGYDLSGDGFGDVPHRPVRLFSLVVERNPVAMVLLRTLFVDLLDLAERIMPVLTPETLVDETPRIRPVATSAPQSAQRRPHEEREDDRIRTSLAVIPAKAGIQHRSVAPATMRASFLALFAPSSR
jgi:nitrous oxidase accessory protein